MNINKPKLKYKNRMIDHDDDKWLIWSNKNGCWYRPNSCGYTMKLEDAGLYSKDEAEKHYRHPSKLKYDINTEPFPLSSVVKQLKKRKLELLEQVKKIDKLLWDFI